MSLILKVVMMVTVCQALLYMGISIQSSDNSVRYILLSLAFYKYEN